MKELFFFKSIILLTVILFGCKNSKPLVKPIPRTMIEMIGWSLDDDSMTTIVLPIDSVYRDKDLRPKYTIDHKIKNGRTEIYCFDWLYLNDTPKVCSIDSIAGYLEFHEGPYSGIYEINFIALPRKGESEILASIFTISGLPDSISQSDLKKYHGHIHVVVAGIMIVLEDEDILLDSKIIEKNSSNNSNDIIGGSDSTDFSEFFPGLEDLPSEPVELVIAHEYKIKHKIKNGRTEIYCFDGSIESEDKPKVCNIKDVYGYLEFHKGPYEGQKYEIEFIAFPRNDESENLASIFTIKNLPNNISQSDLKKYHGHIHAIVGGEMIIIEDEDILINRK